MTDIKVTFDSVTKTWCGGNEPYIYGNASLTELAFNNMKANLKHVCQINDEDGESYTYERMLKAAVSFATFLRELGIKKGDMALLFTENYHYMAATWLGCSLAGAILCPFVFTESSVRAEIKDLVEAIDPKIMVTSDLPTVKEFQSIFKELNINCPIYIYENQIPGCHDLKPLLEREVDIESFKVEPISDPDKDLFMLALSSSTTGKSKLIKTTHKQMIFARISTASDLIFATTMKPGWATECLMLFWSLASCDLRIIRAHYTIDEFLQMVEKYKVNFIFTKPKDVFAMIHSEAIKTVDLSHLKFLTSTGEHLSIKVGEEMQKYLPNGLVRIGFGISDVGYGITIPNPKLVANCVGYIRPNIQIRIIGENEQRLGVNEIGELYVKAIASFCGYYKNDKLTKESATEDGFFKTGDIGYVDELGRIFLVERKKFLISYRGGWINLSEIEKIVLENVPGINGVCAIDVEHKEHGVIPIIVIIPKKGVKLDEQDVIQRVYKHHEFPFETRVFFMEKLPLTISGKYKKYVIRDMILSLIK